MKKVKYNLLSAALWGGLLGNCAGTPGSQPLGMQSVENKSQEKGSADKEEWELIQAPMPDDDEKTADSGDTNAQTNTVASASQVHIIDGFVGGKLGEKSWMYTPAMGFAWLLLSAHINEPLVVSLGDKEVKGKNIVAALNKTSRPEKVLDQDSYYSKMGWGNAVVEEIRKTVYERFSEQVLKGVQLDKNAMLAFAFFKKAVAYSEPMVPMKTRFKGKYVLGCGIPTVWDGRFGFDLSQEAAEKKQKIVSIVDYQHQENFIVGLALKNKGEALFLAKVPNNVALRDVLQQISLAKKVERMDFEDQLSMPQLKVSQTLQYKELAQKTFANKKLEGLRIDSMYEKVDFMLDEKGAKVKSEAAIMIAKGCGRGPRIMQLNSDFWLIMQQKGGLQPYFILRVGDTDLMHCL